MTMFQGTALQFSRVTDDLRAALEELLEETNPFMTDADGCECGEHGDGWSEGGGKGTPCVHIRAVRAIEAAKGANR